MTRRRHLSIPDIHPPCASRFGRLCNVAVAEVDGGWTQSLGDDGLVYLVYFDDNDMSIWYLLEHLQRDVIRYPTTHSTYIPDRRSQTPAPRLWLWKYRPHPRFRLLVLHRFHMVSDSIKRVSKDIGAPLFSVYLVTTSDPN